MDVASSSLRWLIVVTCGCSFDPGLPNQPPEAGTPGEAGPDAPSMTGHLLLSEIQVTGGFEFIEIYNPTASPILLTNYYLSDCDEYWKVPGLGLAETIMLSPTDFLVRFPAGQQLGPGAIAVIAIDEAAFAAEYLIDPTYTTQVTAVTSMAMSRVIDPGVTPSLTDEGELVVLFQWDGLTDRVADVDLVVHGLAPTATNVPKAKLGIDGPDPDTATSSYAVDLLSIGDMAADQGGKRSYKRILPEGDKELHDVGGNGITGDDETSEQIRVTWDQADTNGTPGAIPASLQ